MLNRAELVGLIERIVAPFGILFGVLLINNGILYAMKCATFAMSYSLFYVGVFMSMIGIVMVSLGYLIFHGKIRLRRS
jgi:hypothetical protein